MQNLLSQHVNPSITNLIILPSIEPFFPIIIFNLAVYFNQSKMLRSLSSLSRLSNRAFVPARPSLLYLASVTRFCSTQNAQKKNIDEEEEEPKVDQSSLVGKYDNEIKTAMTIGGGSVVFYGISKLFYDVALSFMSLTPAISLKYGFWGGILSAASMSSLFYSFDKAVSAKPELAFDAGLKIANNSEDLRSLLGGYLQHNATDMKMYRSKGGSFGVINGSPTWTAPRVEMLFTGSGPFGHCNVLVISTQELRRPVIEFVGADIISEASRTRSKRTRITLQPSKDGNDDSEFALMDRLIQSASISYREPN